MAVKRELGGTSFLDVLDRVLDKGIVIDARMEVSFVGIDLITVRAHVVVASIETYLNYFELVGTSAGRLLGSEARIQHPVEIGDSTPLESGR